MTSNNNSDTKRCFKINKLVRDKVPEIMRSIGVNMIYRIMDNDEYNQRLKDKLMEESLEVIEAKNQDEIKEELADVLEVLMSISKLHNIPFDDIEKARINKKIENGGLDNRIYNEFSEVNSDNNFIEYFLANPDKYPEIK